MKKDASPKRGNTLMDAFYAVRAEKKAKPQGESDKSPSPTANPPERNWAEEYLRYFQPAVPPNINRNTHYFKRLTRFDPDIHFKTYTKRGD